MGVQIRIKIASLEERFIPVIISEEDLGLTCRCDKVKQGTCTECGDNVTPETSTTAIVHGLDLVFDVFQGELYHDANRYGSSRGKLLAFIEDRGLMAGVDWNES